MLTYVQGPRDRLTTAKVSTTVYQGQWVFMDGEDTEGEFQVSPVASYANAQKARYLLAPVFKHAFQSNGADSTYEAIYPVGHASDDGRFPGVMLGEGHLIEDDQLVSRVSADFDAANYGDAMVLTISGYPTLDGADDDQGSGSTVVAVFVNKLGDMVTYLTV